MLPRYHLLLGAIFTLTVWVSAPLINPIYLATLFLSTVFMDLDHYYNAVKKTKKWSLRCAFDYHHEQKKITDNEKKAGIRIKGDFHLFHTVEFHLLIGILGAFILPFLFIFIGMVFHSILDLIWTLHEGVFYRREYFLFNWLRNKF